MRVSFVALFASLALVGCTADDLRLSGRACPCLDDWVLQDGPNALASFAPITFRADGAYRTYQVPLSELGKTFASYDGVLDGFTIGGEWGNGATIRLDSVFVRW